MVLLVYVKKFLSYYRLILTVILTASMLIGVSGCSGSEAVISLKNLDLSDTIVTENVPESGAWESLRFEQVELTSSSKDKLEQIVNGFCPALAFDHNKVMIKSLMNDDVYDIPYAEAKGDEFSEMTMMRYLGDEIYIELYDNDKFEMYNRKTVLDSIGKEWTSEWMWRPHFSGTVKKQYEINTETDLSETYPLCGNYISIAEALSFAQNTIKEGKIPYICAAGCKTQPISVEVFKFDETHYGYIFKIQIIYDNVPIDATKTASYANPEGDICPISIDFFTFTGNTVDWIWTTPLNGESAEKEECSMLISYEEACTVLSEELSPDFIFEVESAELNYSLKIVQEGENAGNYIIPTWRFRVVDLSGFNDFSVLYIYIDAETKDLYTTYAVA